MSEIFNDRKGLLIHMCRRHLPERASGTASPVFRVLLLSFVVVALCLSGMTAAAQADPVGSDAPNQTGVDGGIQTLDEGETTGNVTGTVSTEQGYILADADVRLVNSTSGETVRTNTSDSDGDYTFMSVEPGAYRIEAEFEGSEGSEDVTVREGTTRGRDVEVGLQEAYFSVSVEDANFPVTEGEELRVDATVTNRGQGSGSQAVVLDVPGLGSDAEPVSLDGYSSETVSLRLPTELGDAGNYTAEVSTNDDTEEVDGNLEERQTGMGVSVSGTNSPVTEGGTLTVEARVSNPSEVSGSGTVTAEVDGETLGSDSERFSLGSGDEETKSLDIPTKGGDAGEYTVTVSVQDAEDSTNVTVEEDAEDDSGDNETEAPDRSAPDVEVTEEADEFVRFRLTEDGDLEEAYLTFEPEGWESARVIAGLDEGASVTVRTEAAAEKLLESEMVFVPGSVSHSDGSIDSREATESERVTCLYDHGGYTLGDSTVPSEIDLPCHAPVLGEAPEVDEGSGTPISLEEGEYRLVGEVGGEETVLRSYTVETVEQETNETVTEDADAGTETGENEEDEEGAGSEEADGSGGDVEDTQEGQGLSVREVARYLGIGAAALVGFAVFAAFSVFVVRSVRERDWGDEGSDEERGQERMVLDTDSKNDVYLSWSGMIERAGVEDVRTKTPKEIAESAKESGLAPEAVDELTDVFEEVRYRDAEPTAEQEKRAKRAFERIKRHDRRT